MQVWPRAQSFPENTQYHGHNTVITSLESSKETLGMEAQASSWGTSLSPWSRYTPLESNTPLSYISSSSGSPAPATNTAQWADVSADSQEDQKHQSKDVWNLCTEPFLQAGSRTLWPSDCQCWCPLRALSPGGLYSRGPSWSGQMMPSQMPVQHIQTQNVNFILNNNLSTHGHKVTTLAFSMTFANSPLHMKQCLGVMRRKQSPLLRERAVGSTKRTWTCLRPAGEAASLKKHYLEALFKLINVNLCL